MRVMWHSHHLALLYAPYFLYQVAVVLDRAFVTECELLVNDVNRC